MEDFGAHAQAFGEGLGAARHDHEFLHVDGGVGVGAAVDDVHHRDGQDVGVEAAEVAVERDAEGIGGGTGHGHGDAEHGVGAELGLGFGAVELEQGVVDRLLVAGIQAAQGLGDGTVDVRNRLEDALAEVAPGVAVAEFEGFIDAGGGAGGDGRATEDTAAEADIGFEGGVAAGIEDFAGADGFDVEHVFSPLVETLSRPTGWAGGKASTYTGREKSQMKWSQSRPPTHEFSVFGGLFHLASENRRPWRDRPLQGARRRELVHAARPALIRGCPRTRENGEN